MHERQESRLSTSIPIDVRTMSSVAPYEMKTVNISAGGAYVESELYFFEGEHLLCSFGLPGTDQKFQFYSQVVRTCYDSQFNLIGPFGFGIKFLDLTETERKEIQKTLSLCAEGPLNTHLN